MTPPVGAWPAHRKQPWLGARHSASPRPVPYRAGPSRARCRKLQPTGRKLRPRAGLRLAPAPPRPRLARPKAAGARVGPWSDRCVPGGGPRRPGGATNPLPPSERRPAVRGAHLLALWSPSPSCARRGRRARAHTLRLLPRSRATWAPAEALSKGRSSRDKSPFFPSGV